MKGTKIYSILKGRCPVCHSAPMYRNPNPYIITETLLMHERCSNCNTKFKIEPSFFYGAMYVSYPVGIIFAALAFAVSFWILDLNLLQSFFVILGVLVFMLPVITRLARNIWINFFFKFDKKKIVRS